MDQITLLSHSFAASIPGITRVEVGRSLPSDRPGVDGTFDLAIIMQFENESSLRAYETNSIHVHALVTLLKPASAKVVIYDSVVRDLIE